MRGSCVPQLTATQGKEAMFVEMGQLYVGHLLSAGSFVMRKREMSQVVVSSKAFIEHAYLLNILCA